MRFRDKYAFLLKKSVKTHTYVFFEAEQLLNGHQTAIYRDYRYTAREVRYRDVHAFLLNIPENIIPIWFLSPAQPSAGHQGDFY